MITVVSRPDDVSAAYLNVQYVFTSDRSPNVIAGESANLLFVRKNSGSSRAEVYLNGIFKLKAGDFLKIEGNPLYNGIHKILGVTETNVLFILDTPFIGDAFGGTVSIYYNNLSIVLDLFIEGAFIIRVRTKRNSDDEFVFDLQRFVQANLGSDLLTLSVDTISDRVDIAKNIFVKYAEEFDVDGELTTAAFTDDVANTKLIVNSTIDYVKLVNGELEIKTTAYDMTPFTPVAVTSGWLTNSPTTRTIQAVESAQMSFVFVFDGSTFFRKVVTFDNTGAVIGTTSTVIAVPGSDSVINVSVGTDNLGAIITAATVRYEVSITSTGIAQPMETMTFLIDSDCHENLNTFYWVNALGGIDTFSFLGNWTSSEDVIRSKFKRNLNFPRVIPERQNTSITNVPIETFTSNSGKVIKEIAAWLRELTESPEVYLRVSNEYLPVDIVSDSLPDLNTQGSAFEMEFEWMFAYDKIRQRN